MIDGLSLEIFSQQFLGNVEKHMQDDCVYKANSEKHQFKCSCRHCPRRASFGQGTLVFCFYWQVIGRVFQCIDPVIRCCGTLSRGLLSCAIVTQTCNLNLTLPRFPHMESATSFSHWFLTVKECIETLTLFINLGIGSKATLFLGGGGSLFQDDGCVSYKGREGLPQVMNVILCIWSPANLTLYPHILASDNPVSVQHDSLKP